MHAYISLILNAMNYEYFSLFYAARMRFLHADALHIVDFGIIDERVFASRQA